MFENYNDILRDINSIKYVIEDETNYKVDCEIRDSDSRVGDIITITIVHDVTPVTFAAGGNPDHIVGHIDGMDAVTNRVYAELTRRECIELSQSDCYIEFYNRLTDICNEHKYYLFKKSLTTPDILVVSKINKRSYSRKCNGVSRSWYYSRTI